MPYPAFLAELIDCFEDTLICTPGYLSGSGDWIASGEVLSLPAHIEGAAQLVRDPASGQEVVSSMQCIVPPNDLTVDTYRYTLPSRYSPNANLRAITVDKMGDENGPVYEEVIFP